MYKKIYNLLLLYIYIDNNNYINGVYCSFTYI